VDKERIAGNSSFSLDDIVVKSRSLSTDYEPENSPVSPQGHQVMMEDYNINMIEHRSKLLSEVDINEAFMLIPVKRDLGRIIIGAYPSAADKLFNLSADIQDPWKQPISVYRTRAAEISPLLMEVYQALTKSCS
jgi:protein-tyrosine-phosphatase